MSFADFREDEETMIRFGFNAQIGKGQLAHAVTQRHEGTFVAMKLKGPFGGYMFCCHNQFLLYWLSSAAENKANIIGIN
jgi:hypothetical protein